MIMQISSSMHNRTKETCALRITFTTSYGISLKYLPISNNLLQKLLIRFAYRTHQNKWEMADSSLLFYFVLLGQTLMRHMQNTTWKLYTWCWFLSLVLIFISVVQIKYQNPWSLHDVGVFCENLCRLNNKKQAIRHCTTYALPLAWVIFEWGAG